MSHFPIKTIVVLVLENRSFDHMLGWMKSINREINGVTGNESNPISTTDLSSSRVLFKNESEYVDPDPGHTFQAVYEQVYGVKWGGTPPESNVPTMDGFAQQAESKQVGLSDTVMNGFRPESIPVFKELVQEFAVFDRWFASLPTETQPNRLFVHSATSHGSVSNDRKRMIEGYPQKTIFESLDEADCSFGIYYQTVPATILYRNLRKLKYVRKFHQYDLHFKRHCEEGKLPNYVVIEPRYFGTKLLPANDDHPAHDIAEGQNFVKQVYESLRASPQWNEMLLIITYDEHGGFYDHVPTPASGVPSPDDIVSPDPTNFKFDRLGVRVPTIMVSPWIERGTVVHEATGPYPSSEYEHSSIPATVKKIFNLNDFLTKRDAWAGTFESVINRDTPRTDCPVSMPDAEKLRKEDEDEERDLSEFQAELVQLAATLNGDHTEDIFPQQLVDMKVKEATGYVEDSFKKFCDACDDAKNKGADDSDIIAFVNQLVQKDSRKSFARKVFSCCICNN